MFECVCVCVYLILHHGPRLCRRAVVGVMWHCGGAAKVTQLDGALVTNQEVLNLQHIKTTHQVSSEITCQSINIQLLISKHNSKWCFKMQYFIHMMHKCIRYISVHSGCRAAASFSSPLIHRSLIQLPKTDKPWGLCVWWGASVCACVFVFVLIYVCKMVCFPPRCLNYSSQAFRIVLWLVHLGSLDYMKIDHA